LEKCEKVEKKTFLIKWWGNQIIKFKEEFKLRIRKIIKKVGIIKGFPFKSGKIFNP